MKKFSLYREYLLLFTLSLGLISCGGGNVSAPSDTEEDRPMSEGPIVEQPDVPVTQDAQAMLPIVTAGRRQFSDPNVIVILKGTAVAAEGATIEQVRWEHVSGPEVSITDPTALETAIVVPDIQQEAQITFRLNAQDSNGNMESATTFLYVSPAPTFTRVVGGAVQEGQANFPFNIRVDTVQENDIPVNYTTQDGTALAGFDYIKTTGTALLLAGESEVRITVPLLPGNIKAGGESFSLQATLALSNGTYSSNVGLALIQDNPMVPHALKLPVLVDASTQDLTVGVGIEPIQFANTGGGSLTACSAEELPTGLTVNISASGNTCEITGTPLQAQDSVNYRIRAHNPDGSADAVISIAILPSLATPALVQSGPLNYTEGVPITIFSLPNSGGGELLTCDTLPALPAGITLTVSADGSTCEISGTPVTFQPQAEYTITASNHAGTSNVLLNIAVHTLLHPPSLENAPQQNYSLERAIPALRFSNLGGGALTSCIADGLPDGLQINVTADLTSCEITGIPTSEQAAAVHTITAINASVNSNTEGNSATVVFTVNEPDNYTPFITQWRTDNAGESEDNQIIISTSPLFRYNYQVDWGDGTTDLNVTGNITHTYADAGTYTIVITEDFPQLYFQGQDAEKLLSIEQWGSQQWLSMENAFNGCINLELNASDRPDLSQVKSMQGMFTNAAVFNGELDSWDVSSVTNMQGLFQNASAFNGDLASWDVSSVTNMANMFQNASVFNSDLNAWNVSSVTNMQSMFLSASAFNSNIRFWDVSSVRNMQGMFDSAALFNGDLSAWDVSSVTNMGYMFSDAVIFNQDLSAWNVSSVTGMIEMFRNASAFNSDLSAWNVSAVANMFGMFAGVTLSTANYDALLMGWAAQNLQNNVPFHGGNSLYSIEAQNARNTLAEIFSWRITDGGPSLAAPKITISEPLNFTEAVPIETISLLNSGGGDLSTCSSQTALPTGINLTVSVDGSTCEISGTPSDVQAQTEYTLTASNTSGSSDILVNITVNALLLAPSLENATSQIYAVDRAISSLRFANSGGGALTGCSADSLPEGLQVSVTADLTSCEITGTPTREQETAVYTITAVNASVDSNTTTNSAGVSITVTLAAGSIPFITQWKTDNPGESDEDQIMISTSPQFEYDYQVNWGDGTTDSNVTGNITHTYPAAGTYTIEITEKFPQIYFQGQDAEKLLTVTQWGNQQWLSMRNAFSGCTNLEFNTSDVPDLSLVNDMQLMFFNATTFNGDLSEWDVSSVTNMQSLFANAAAFNGDLSRWDVSSVTNMQSLFANATEFNGDLSRWDVSSVTNMQGLLTNVSVFNGDLSAWDVSSVTSMANLFSGASAFNQDIGNWDVSSVTSMQQMFLGSAFNGDLSAWDVSSVENMAGMFRDTSFFNSNLNRWDVSSVTSMSAMFYQAPVFNQDLSAWDVSSVADMQNMFNSASEFNQDISTWNVSSVENMVGMFSSATLSTVNYDALLFGWAAQNLQGGVIFDGGNSQYSLEAQSAKDVMEEFFDWTIRDGGPIFSQIERTPVF